MRKQLLTNLFVVANMVVAMCSCDHELSDDFPSDTSDALVETQIENPFAYIGDIHNASLEAARMQKIEFDSIASFTRSFIDQSLSDVTNNLPKDFSISCERKAIMIGLIRQNGVRSRGDEQFIDSLYSSIPPQLEPYVKKMTDLIAANLSDSTAVENSFAMVDQQIIENSELMQEDKDGLLVISAITKSSYLFNMSNISSRAVTAEGVVRADAEAALCTFIQWRFWGKALTGLMFGPTGLVMQATKEIVKGAAIGSTVHVAINLMD